MHNISLPGAVPCMICLVSRIINSLKEGHLTLDTHRCTNWYVHPVIPGAPLIDLAMLITRSGSIAGGVEPVGGLIVLLLVLLLLLLMMSGFSGCNCLSCSKVSLLIGAIGEVEDKCCNAFG